jgi:hypothetical protein
MACHISHYHEKKTCITSSDIHRVDHSTVCISCHAERKVALFVNAAHFLYKLWGGCYVVGQTAWLDDDDDDDDASICRLHPHAVANHEMLPQNEGRATNDAGPLASTISYYIKHSPIIHGLVRDCSGLSAPQWSPRAFANSWVRAGCIYFYYDAVLRHGVIGARAIDTPMAIHS